MIRASLVLYSWITLSVSPFFLSACGSGASSGGPPVNAPSNYSATATGPNVLPITVGGTGICGTADINQPCTSVTVCVPGTTNCQTISDIIVDTGSFGLRVFSSALTLPLPAVTDTNNHPLAECAPFGSGETWGPVVSAQVTLGSEPSVQVPIQLINFAFPTPPTGQCPSSSTYQSPSGTSSTALGGNGLLGVGLFKYDCSPCATHSNVNVYFSCNGGTCTSTLVPLANQLQNPIALLPVDNNGLIFQLPNIPAAGANNVTGSVIMGIDTQSNNASSGTTMYTTDASGNFTTNFNAKDNSRSFIDSGSNGLFFASTLTPCQGNGSGFYCPSSTANLSAVNTSASGSPQVQVNFQIANEASLLNSNNAAFNNLGGAASLGGFDWGLPFFFGRKVYVGIDGVKSSLGTGPYWGF